MNKSRFIICITFSFFFIFSTVFPLSPQINTFLSLDETKIILENYDIKDAVIITPYMSWHSSPALADLTGDGNLDIILVSGENYAGVWRSNGLPMEGWPQRTNRLVNSLAVGDLNKDGKLEIVSTEKVWNSQGQVLLDLAKGGIPNIFCTPSLVDLEGDGKLEILYTDVTAGICIRRMDGSFLKGWPVALPNNEIRCTPIACDINHDGKKEIVFLHEESNIYAYNLDGKLLPGFPKVLPANQQQSMCLSDLNKNGEWYALAGTSALNLLTGKIVSLGNWRGGMAPCLIPSSDTINPWITAGPYLPNYYNIRYRSEYQNDDINWWSDSAVAADIVGDGKIEVLSGNRNGSYYAVSADGTMAPGWPKHLFPNSDCALAVSDLNGNGNLNVICPTQNGRIYIFDCPGSSETSYKWPVFMANNLRNGIWDSSLLPHATKKDLPVTPHSQLLRKSLASGDWDTAIQIYESALNTIRNNNSQFLKEQKDQLRQNGLLSIARILNTRAKRFPEAINYYKQAIIVNPESWNACQALTELLDICKLYPNLKESRSALEDSYELCKLNMGKFPNTYKDIYTYLLAETAFHLEKPDVPSFLAKFLPADYLVQLKNNSYGYPFRNSGNYLQEMAYNIARYEDAPFLVTLNESKFAEIRTREKNFYSGLSQSGTMEMKLGVSPHSPIMDDFHVHIMWNLDSSLLVNSTTNKNTTYSLETDCTIQSVQIGTEKGEGITFHKMPYTLENTSIQRDVKRIDDTHMLVKFIIKNPFNDVSYDIFIDNLDSKIELDKVISPIKPFLNSEKRIKLLGNKTPTPLSGDTVIFTVQIPKGKKCFYPFFVLAAFITDQQPFHGENQITNSIDGSSEGILYTLSSDRKFKITEFDKRFVLQVYLDRLDADF